MGLSESLFLKQVADDSIHKIPTLSGFHIESHSILMIHENRATLSLEEKNQSLVPVRKLKIGHLAISNSKMSHLWTETC
jgi:hypothetical protein